jgi:hypothetical protein
MKFILFMVYLMILLVTHNQSIQQMWQTVAHEPHAALLKHYFSSQKKKLVDQFSKNGLDIKYLLYRSMYLNTYAIQSTSVYSS